VIVTKFAVSKVYFTAKTVKDIEYHQRYARLQCRGI
jgi:hypothetical protein